MPQGRRRHKKESKGFKPWQRNALPIEREASPQHRNTVVAPRTTHAPRRSVSPAAPMVNSDISYREILEGVRNTDAPYNPLPNMDVRIGGFRRSRNRVPVIPNFRKCDGTTHVWRNTYCLHGDGLTVVGRQCRDCSLFDEQTHEREAEMPNVWINWCHADCDLEAAEGGDFCAFHECNPQARYLSAYWWMVERIGLPKGKREALKKKEAAEAGLLARGEFKMATRGKLIGGVCSPAIEKALSSPVAKPKKKRLRPSPERVEIFV